MLRKVVLWMLVPTAMVLVVVGGIAGGRWIVNLADDRCATEHMIGGACVEPWQTGFIEIVIYLAIVLTALGLTLAPAAIAPALKRTVAVFGALVTVASTGTLYYITGWSEFMLPTVVAIVSASVGVCWVWLWSNKHAVG